MIRNSLVMVVRTFRSARVVPVLICAALLTVTMTAQRGGQAPTLVIVNGKILNADGTFSEAVAMAGTQILRVGSTRDISASQSPATRVIDARGRAVVPGIDDTSGRGLRR